MKKQILIIFLCLFTVLNLTAQKYIYSIDLNKVVDDKLKVSLQVPTITKTSIVFHFPKIIPGTYRISDFGKFVHDLKALDKSGKPLLVKKIADNSWQISNANKMARIEYWVEDTWDSKIKHSVYSMSGTNIEEGKNIVVNTPGFFGYLEGMKTLPFELRFKKPASFYAATPLKPLSTSDTEDVFLVNDIDHMYDSPIMFSIPDTTTVHVGNTDVLVAVYSPKKQVQSKFIAQLMKDILIASSKYLGGKLPVDKYAFIFYFNGEQEPFATSGALEHNYSSFYSLPESPQQSLAGLIVDIGAHEFFHIISPLTISSREVKQFDFTKPVMSKHLWLYEGSTEYASDHVQVKYGLITVNQFLGKVSLKIINSKTQYKDDLAFTELSKEAAGKHGDQFGNVYEKGALISACLDIYLLHLSDGAYDLARLKNDLSVRFGKKNSFNDEALFDVITELSYPEVRSFFAKYVESNQPIPYDYFFGLAGAKYVPLEERKDFTLGKISMNVSKENKVIISDVSQMNDFGKKMGYKKLDEIISINGKPVTVATMENVLSTYKNAMKEGDPLTMVVARKNAEGISETITLSAPAELVTIKEEHKLTLMNDVSMKQALVRKAWLAADDRGVPLAGDKKDIGEIDQIINTLYNVISGPAGKRNWERFRSIFTANAYMGTVIPAGAGSKFIHFTPEEYIKNNDKIFMQDAFKEKEVSRKVNSFGNVAQVFTTYDFDMGNGKVKQRGINSVQLVREQGRWWIASIIWQDESEKLPIPNDYLN